MSDVVKKKRGRPAKPKTKIIRGQREVEIDRKVSIKTWMNCPYFKNGINDALNHNSFYEYPTNNSYPQRKYEEGRFAGVILRDRGFTKIETRQGRGGPLSKEIESILMWNFDDWHVPDRIVDEPATDQ